MPYERQSSGAREAPRRVGTRGRQGRGRRRLHCKKDQPLLHERAPRRAEERRAPQGASRRVGGAQTARRQTAALLLQACCCELSSLVARASSARAARTRPLAATHAAVAAYEVIQANACTGTGEHSASEARRCLYFLPSAGNAALPQPQGARARLAPPQPPPRGGAAASAHALATAAARRGARAGRIGPKKRAASRSSGPARQEESLRWLGAGRAAYGARRRQAAATGAVRAALLYAAVARPSCRAIGRGAAC